MLLRHYVNLQGDDWVNYLVMIEFAINNQVSDATKYTLFFVNYGCHPQMDIQQEETSQTSVEEVQEHIVKVRENVVAVLQKTAE